MSDDLFIDNARIVLENGLELKNWSEYTIDSDYLTPTDAWSFTFHPDKEDINWAFIRQNVRPDYKVQIYIGDYVQLTGWIDSVACHSSHSGGLTFNVQGRDVLKTLVKSNIHPDFKIKGRKIIEILRDVVEDYYADPPNIILQDDQNRTIQGIASKHQGKRTIAAIQAKLGQVQAHPHEGAFEFLSRNLRPFGLWLWASGDGTLVVGCPDYEQAPSYQIIRRVGEPFNHVTVMDATFTHDRTALPTSVTIWGRGVQKEFEKSKLVSCIIDPLARSDFERAAVREPIYIRHDQAETKEACNAYAWQEMSRYREKEIIYKCTCVGHRDKRTGNIYNIDTMATVKDEFLDIDEDMFVVGRTFHKNSSGTTTELRLVPKNSIIFMDVDTPTEPTKPGEKKKLEPPACITPEEMERRLRAAREGRE